MSDSERPSEVDEVVALVRDLGHLCGVYCWGFSAGAGTGTVVALDFGKRSKRERPLRNPNLTEEQRTHEAEYSLMVYCAWRLDDSDSVICGSGDSNQPGGPMLTGLEKVVGKKVLSIEIADPGLDLDLSFDGLRLRCFCDQVNEDEEEENYTFFTPDRIYTVVARSTIVVEERDEPRRS